MKLSNMMESAAILQLESATDKWSLIRQLVDALAQTPFAQELSQELRDSFYGEIEKREQLGSTGLGEGVALPHARIDGLERPLIAFATLQEPIDFASLDGKPTQLIFLILLPLSRAELGVKINSACTRFLIRPEIRTALLAASSAEAVLEIMEEAAFEIDAPIIALDLMRPERVRLCPDQLIQEASQLMHRNRTIAAPVLDADRRVIGEINCNQLFQHEIPDYIKNLHSVPHISDFAPFHKYFTQDTAVTVGDLMNECESTIEENASLLEILFLLSVKKHPLLYVCRKGRLIGVIDAITVADKIFNL